MRLQGTGQLLPGMQGISWVNRAVTLIDTGVKFRQKLALKLSCSIFLIIIQ